jgi:hypothetical protein
MAKRGSLYRCHLFSYGGPQTEGIEAFWASNLQPIGEAPVLSGTAVELYARVDATVMELQRDARLRFDILEEDFLLTGGLDDKLDSLVGPGATPEEGFTALPRELDYVELAANASAADYLDLVRRRDAPGYRDRVLVLHETSGEGEERVRTFHVIAFWTAERREDFAGAELYFIVNANDTTDDTSNEVLNVGSEEVPRPTRASDLRVEETAPRDAGLLREARAEVLADFLREQEMLDAGAMLPQGTPPPSEPAVETGSDPALREAARMRVATPLPVPPGKPPPPSERDAWVSVHPSGPLEEDRIVAGASPFEGNLAAIFPPWEGTMVATRRHGVAYNFAPRHAVSKDFARAIYWGWLLFGARSFAVIEGPLFRDEAPRYYTVRLDRSFNLNTFQSGHERLSVGGAETRALHKVGVDVRYWQIEQFDRERTSHVLRLLGTTDSAVVIPIFRIHANESTQQLIAAAKLLGGTDDNGALLPFEDWLPSSIPRDTARASAFASVEAAIGRGNDEAAVGELLQLNHHAFILLTTAERTAYLRRLLAALTVWRRIVGAEPVEDTIVDIVRSVASEPELASLLGTLGRDDVNLIVGRMDHRLWGMLVDLGKRFGAAHPFTVDSNFLINLFLSGFGGTPLIPVNIRIAVGPDGQVSISESSMEQLTAAANGFLRFGRGFVAGLWTLVSEPEKVAQGVWAIVKAAAMMDLARQGVPFAQEYVAREVVPVFQRAGRSIADGYKGILVLQGALGPEGPGFVADLIDRIKWAIVWEVASLFVGVGEIKAAAQVVVRGVEEAAALVRFSRTITTTERAVAELDGFARLVVRGGTAEAGTSRQILSHLPEEDVAALSRALSGTDISSARNLEQLMQRLAPEARPAAHQAANRMRALQTLERRFPGTLAQDGGDGFRRLASMPGATDEGLRGVVEGTRAADVTLAAATAAERVEMDALLDVARRLDPSVARGAVTFDLARGIAARPAAYRHLVAETPELFTRMLQHSGGDLAVLERNLDGLNFLRRQAADEAARAALARRVVAGEPAALREVTNARRALNVMKGRCFF